MCRYNPLDKYYYVFGGGNGECVHECEASHKYFHNCVCECARVSGSDLIERVSGGEREAVFVYIHSTLDMYY